MSTTSATSSRQSGKSASAPRTRPSSTTKRVRKPPARLGVQAPRIRSVPAYTESAGREAIDLGRSAGLTLDPWQEIAVTDTLGWRDDGQWASFEAVWIVSRQNGKGSGLEVIELAALYLLHEELIVHTAHEFKTAAEAFRRIDGLIDGRSWLSRKVKRVSRSNGEEGIELWPRPTVITGADGRQITRGVSSRLRFFARTGGSGRGFSGNRIIFDEGYNLPEMAITALMPTLATKHNPQILYTSSAVDKENPAHRNGEVLSRLRRRGLRGDDSLCYLEWSVDEELYAADPRGVSSDPDQWARANPGLGIRITEEYIGRELRAMGVGSKAFAVERLSVGDWFEDSEEGFGTIPREKWEACGNREARFDPDAMPALAVDVTPNRVTANIAGAGMSRDGERPHVQLLEQCPTIEAHEKIVKLAERRGCPVFIDPGSPAGALIPKLEDAGVEVERLTLTGIGQACGGFYDRVIAGDVSHLGQKPLDDAVRQASTRPVSRDAWAWDCDTPGAISPLVAATYALHGWTLRGALDPLFNLW